MKGSLLVVLLIAMLIVGILVMKNIGGDSEDENTKSKIESVNQAKDTAEDAQKVLDDANQRLKDAD